jgi:hypothetical protein
MEFVKIINLQLSEKIFPTRTSTKKMTRTIVVRAGSSLVHELFIMLVFISTIKPEIARLGLAQLVSNDLLN